jgi:hypothetical protein
MTSMFQWLTAVMLLAARETPEAAISSTAAGEFAAGERAFAAGDYLHAAESFERAYELSPHPDAMWNVARSWERTGELARAANAYDLYLRTAPPGARDREQAIAALRAAAARVGRLEIQAPDLSDVRVDDRPARGRNVYVNPGVHTVSGRRQDNESQRVSLTVSVSGGQITSVVLDPTINAATAMPTMRTAAPDSAATPVLTAVATPARDRSGALGLATWISAGATALGTAATVISGLDTRRARDAFDRAPTQHGLDEGRAKQLRTNILLASSAVLLVATAVFWWLDHR